MASSALLELASLLLDAAANAEHRTWLIVFPASGAVRRCHGALLTINMGGELGQATFLVGAAVTALDPRCLVVDDETLRVAYHPREHLDAVHPAAKSWFAENPGTFQPGTPNVSSPLGAKS